MQIALTRWALESYTKLLHRHIVTKRIYRHNIRPETLKLRRYPHDPKFSRDSLTWGPATEGNGNNIKSGFKLKWRSLGPNGIELRVCVVLTEEVAFICEGYAKTSSNEKREMGRLKKHIGKLLENKAQFMMGELR